MDHLRTKVKTGRSELKTKMGGFVPKVKAGQVGLKIKMGLPNSKVEKTNLGQSPR